MSTPNKYPRRALPTHEQACHNFASMICGLPLHGKGIPTPAQFWLKLSNKFQEDISGFVTRWPPGKSKERGMYRDDVEKPLPPVDPDVTQVSPL